MVRWLVFVPAAVLVTAMCCVAGWLLVGMLHPHDGPIISYGLTILGLAFAWSWAIQLLLDAAR